MRYGIAIIRLAHEDDGTVTDAVVFHFLGDAVKMEGTGYYMLHTPAGYVGPGGAQPAEDGDGGNGEGGNIAAVDGAESADDEVMDLTGMEPQMLLEHFDGSEVPFDENGRE